MAVQRMKRRSGNERQGEGNQVRQHDLNNLPQQLHLGPQTTLGSNGEKSDFPVQYCLSVSHK
jgi:hypothetical protein